MKSKPSKILALLMAMAIVFSLAACGKEKEPVNTTTPTESASADTTADETAAESATTVINGTTTTVAGTTAISSGTTAVPVNTVPTTKAEILTAYTAVMDKAKSDAPAYKKIEYQELPNDTINMKNNFVDKLMAQAERFMTSPDEAKTEEEAKGSDMKWFPVYKAINDTKAGTVAKGCFLTNANAIKSAKCEVISEDKYRITIILNDEINPEPYTSGKNAPSNVGGMFDPLATSEINNTLKTDGAVKALISNTEYKITYQNCTAVLEYNPKTNQVLKLDQSMSAFIDITGGKLLYTISLVGTAVLENTLKIWDVQY